MEKKIKVDICLEDAVCISSRLSDFKSDGIHDEAQKWKYAIYQLFRFDMTWGFAHKIEVRENNTTGVFVRLTIKPAYEEQTLELMEILGFRNMQVDHEEIGRIDCTDLPDGALLDYVYVDY